MGEISKDVISHIHTRNDFFSILKTMKQNIFIVKLGAKWCGPCKTIAPIVDAFFASSPQNVLCADLDVDECVDLYSFLKSKRMVNGIPVLLCYHRGNIGYVPDDMVTGADPASLHRFFKRCGDSLTKLDKLWNK